MFAGLPPGHALFDIRRRFVEQAKRIDTISRAVFPLSFLVFNVFYWVTYKVLRNEDIHLALRPWHPLGLLNFPVYLLVNQFWSSVRMSSFIKDIYKIKPVYEAVQQVLSAWVRIYAWVWEHFNKELNKPLVYMKNGWFTPDLCSFFVFAQSTFVLVRCKKKINVIYEFSLRAAFWRNWISLKQLIFCLVTDINKGICERASELKANQETTNVNLKKSQ